MRIILREDSEAVASTVATLFTLLAVVLFLQAAIVAVVPAKQYGAERTTSIAAISAFDMLRSTASGAVFPGGQVTVTLPIGTAAVSPFAAPSPGDLRFNMGDSTRANISVSYVPTIHDSRVSKVDQDIILAIDSSGSMNQNDPNRLRISGAKEYVGRLSRPDRVASVDFDSVARLTRANVGGPAHHRRHLLRRPDAGINPLDLFRNQHALPRHRLLRHGCSRELGERLPEPEPRELSIPGADAPARGRRRDGGPARGNRGPAGDAGLIRTAGLRRRQPPGHAPHVHGTCVRGDRDGLSVRHGAVPLAESG